MKNWLFIIAISAVVVLGAFKPTVAIAGEDIKLEAMATWESKGSVFLVGEKQALFVGGFSGVMFAASDAGGLNAANIVCPGMMDINLESNQTQGSGRCIITGASGHRVFAKWDCAGLAMVGCAGTFTITAGTGRFQGVTGGGDFVLRSAIGQLQANLLSGDITNIGLGLAVWQNLVLKLP